MLLRGDLYHMIHNDVNLRLYILEQSGKNFTNINTVELNNLVNNYQEHHTLAHTVTPLMKKKMILISVMMYVVMKMMMKIVMLEMMSMKHLMTWCFDETDINLIMEFIKNFCGI